MPEVTEKVKTTKPEIAPQKDAKKAPGLQFRRLFTKPGVSPYDEIEWELRSRSDHRCQGQRDLRAKRRRGPQRLVHDRHQHCGVQISARQNRHARARDRRSPARQPSRRNDSRLGHEGRILPHSGRCRHLPRRTRAYSRAAVCGLQLARLVQRRMRPHRAQLRRHQLALEPRRAARRIQRHRIQHPAMLRLLHQLGERFARCHPYARENRRHAL